MKIIVDGPQNGKLQRTIGWKEMSEAFGLIQRKSAAAFYFGFFFNGRNFGQLATVAGGDVRGWEFDSHPLKVRENFIIQFFSITSI